MFAVPCHSRLIYFNKTGKCSIKAVNRPQVVYATDSKINVHHECWLWSICRLLSSLIWDPVVGWDGKIWVITLQWGVKQSNILWPTSMCVCSSQIMLHKNFINIIQFLFCQSAIKSGGVDGPCSRGINSSWSGVISMSLILLQSELSLRLFATTAWFTILLLLKAFGSLDSTCVDEDRLLRITFLCLSGHLSPLGHLPETPKSGQSKRCFLSH